MSQKGFVRKDFQKNKKNVDKVDGILYNDFCVTSERGVLKQTEQNIGRGRSDEEKYSRG